MPCILNANIIRYFYKNISLYLCWVFVLLKYEQKDEYWSFKNEVTELLNS